MTNVGQLRKLAQLRKVQRELAVPANKDRIDEAVLALLYLGRHDEYRTWKGFDWDVMNRLHEKGMISDPVSKAKSVVFTEEGLRESERLFHKLFEAQDR